MKNPVNFERSFVLMVAIMVAVCSFSSPSDAACVAGQPCVTPLTPDTDPFDRIIDPNQPGTPNNPKLDIGDPYVACDADFMNQIYAKAFIEAERETVINNSIILKPDSVLEYSCYDQIAAAVATAAGPLFSELDWPYNSVPNPNSGNISISVNMGATHLDGSIERLVLESLDTYANNSPNGAFFHDFLGGAATGDNNTFSTTVGGVGGVCDFMYNVYHIAKCDDFALNAPFITFEDFGGTGILNLLTTDPRTLPPAPFPQCPAGHRITADLINLAKNYDPGNPHQVWPYAAFDNPVDTHLDLILSPRPASGGRPAIVCEDPIPTGVMVNYVEYGQDLAGNQVIVTPPYQYQDKVCPNPGCYFDNNNNASPGDDQCVQTP